MPGLFVMLLFVLDPCRSLKVDLSRLVSRDLRFLPTGRGVTSLRKVLPVCLFFRGNIVDLSVKSSLGLYFKFLMNWRLILGAVIGSDYSFGVITEKPRLGSLLGSRRNIEAF